MKRENLFKAIVSITVASAFIMPGVAMFANNEKHMDDEMNDVINTESLDFTHTVLAEFGTTSSCPYCPPVNGYLYSIYNSSDYDFYYVTLNVDHETLAHNRYRELPAAKYVPTVWFDGGYSYLIGNQGSTTPYINQIITSGSRSVADIDLNVVVSWTGDAEMEVTVSVTNNEANSYSGHLHVYITEITSRWYDADGKQYHFSMIGHAFDQNINVGAGNTWSDAITWNGDSHGYGDITEDNIMVIATVFDSSNNHVDETTVATPNGNRPPDKPSTPSGPNIGVVGVGYTYTSSTTDPDDDALFYLWDWDDDASSNWVGPYDSGAAIVATHAWDNEGIYDVRVKAKDIYGAESSWSSSLTVYIGDLPIIKIGDIAGSLFVVSVVIRNIGSADATSVDWSITLDGGRIPVGRETIGREMSIPVGENVTVTSDPIFGWGRVVITATAEKQGVSSDTKDADAFVFFFLINVLDG